MAINIVNEKIRSNNIVLDANYGPYNSITEAHNALLDNNKNKVGVTVGIKNNTTLIIEEYWYQGGTTQQHLVKKLSEVDTSNLATKQELQQGLSGKQDIISDLQQIRTRADEGHTALQPIQDATPNNFVIFDENGGIKDSGKKDTDFATAAQGTKADNAIPMPTGTDGQILEKDSNETSGVKWVNKPSDGQDGASAYELYEQAEIAAGRTPLSQEAWLASLKANIGEFLFVPTDAAAVTAMATIGQTYSSAIDPLGKNVAPSQNTLSVILLMNDDATTPTKTMMIATQDDGSSGFEFVYAGDLQSAMSSNVLTEDDLEEFKDFVGKTIIEENPNNAGKYINLNVAIGSTISLQYPSSDSAYHYLVKDCVVGDKIIVNSKIGNNKIAWGFIDSSNKLVERGQPYNVSTPIDLSVELVVPESAVKCIINSRSTDKKSYYSSKDSIYNEFDTRLDDIYEKLEVDNLVNYPIDAITIRDTAIYKTYGIVVSANDWCSVILPITVGMTKLKFTTDIQSDYEYGFYLNDGTWQGTTNANGVKSVDVPNGAKEFRMCYKYAMHPNNKILVTGNKVMLTEIKQNFLFALNRNIDNLYNVVEANNTGRFDYMSVGVNDYINAFNELSYTFPDFVKMTNIGTSQEPSEGASDMNTYPIVRYRYKKSTANPTKVISLMSGIHGDSENPGVAGWKNNGGDSPQNILSLYFFLLDLLMNPEKDGYYKSLTDNYIIDVVPIINPWGVQNHSRTNGRNVDLNRNFDYRWSESTSEFKGSSAFSESESQAYRDYINTLSADTTNLLKFVVEVHSRGNLTTSNQGRFWGVGPSDYSTPKWAQTKVAGKYGTGTPGWTTYDSTNAEPMGWAWTYFVKGIPSFNPECCQSLNGDLSTRNSKLVNVQMVDFISEIILACANAKILQ